MQAEIFPDQLFLKRNMQQNGHQRFFMMVVHRDLFGGASIIRESGEVGRPGTIRIEHHPDEGTAVDALAVIAAKKQKQGYLCSAG
jgi:predicted DNA-binding WGR domain protein